LVAILLDILVIWFRRYPVCPAVSKGRVSQDPFVLEFQTKICVNS
jgi:hypothetical protein